MSAELQVHARYELSGTGLIIAGEIKTGTLEEGMVGMTTRGKRCSIVKIEVANEKVPRATIGQTVAILVKYVEGNDVRPGQVLCFK